MTVVGVRRLEQIARLHPQLWFRETIFGGFHSIRRVETQSFRETSTGLIDELYLGTVIMTLWA
jgi:hypothetical protein